MQAKKNRLDRVWITLSRMGKNEFLLRNWNKYGGKTFAIIRRFVADEELAGKVLVDSFVVLHYARILLKSEEHIHTFLIAVSRQLCFDSLKGNEPAIDLGMFADLAEHIDKWLSSLPDELRKMIQMYFIEGFDQEAQRWRKKTNSAIPLKIIQAYVALHAVIETKFPGFALFRIEEYEGEELPANDLI